MANTYVNHTGSSTPPYDTEAKAATDIQVALDAANSGDTVLIKADQDYVMDGNDQQAAQFDVDANDEVTIKGYYLNPGDQDYGGTYYRDPSHGWVVIDANDGDYDVFVAGDVHNPRFYNLKTININMSNYGFELAASAYKTGAILDNCWVVGNGTGRAIGITGNYYVTKIHRCKITGSFETGAGVRNIIYISAVTYGTEVRGCIFDISNGEQVIGLYSVDGLSIHDNIFNLGTLSDELIDCVTPISFFNNTIYVSGSMNEGIELTGTKKASLIYNNIFVGLTTPIVDYSLASYLGHNCYYNCTNNPSGGINDLVDIDPRFMNAAGGDFRLKPTSPCLNTGEPTMNGGYTSIGAWQRKSLLR